MVVGKTGAKEEGDPNPGAAVVRLNPDGSHDASFDGDGATTIDSLGDESSANAVLLQPGGEIVVGAPAASPPRCASRGSIRTGPRT